MESKALNIFEPMEPMRFWLPLQKAKDADDDDRRIRGISSVETPDLQNEVILQKGIDFRPLLENGYINWDHEKPPEGVIGEPLNGEIIRFDGHPAFFVEGRLFKGKAKADAAWELLNALEKAHSTRKIGWSVEGGVRQRMGKVIVKSVIKHLALTHKPVHVQTFAELCKSFREPTDEDLEKAATSESAAALRMEHLAGVSGYSVDALRTCLWGDCQFGCYDRDGRFYNGWGGALEHLVKCKKCDVKEAKDFLMRLHKSFYS